MVLGKTGCTQWKSSKKPEDTDSTNPFYLVPLESQMVFYTQMFMDAY